MAIYRLQCSFQNDTAFPRDRIVITPHFETVSVLTLDNVDALCEDLADALTTYAGTSGEVRVKGYLANDPPPNLPLGEAVNNEGAMQATGYPREVALCLSYYAAPNTPTRRGRLFLPATWLQGGQMQLKPAEGTMQKALDLAPILANLGGGDVQWVVYSRKNGDAAQVSHSYVDNEWDIVRSRGLRPSSRLTLAMEG